MEHEPRATSVSPSEKTIPIDRDRTLVTPRFDEKSIQRARPAVPIARGAARRFGSSALLVACIVAGLVGGVAGGLALALYQKRHAGGPEPSAVAGAPSTSTSSSPVAAAVVDEAPPAAPADTTAPAAAASEAERAGAASVPPPKNEGEAARGPDGTEEAELRGALDEWIAATNARDIGRQMDFYGETVGAFYLTRNVPREAVRAEKTRVFGSADAIDIRAGQPAVRLSRDGQTATMRFRKKYSIAGGGNDRRGEVVQELRWRRTKDGWKIVSERDLSVID